MRTEFSTIRTSRHELLPKMAPSLFRQISGLEKNRQSPQSCILSYRLMLTFSDIFRRTIPSSFDFSRVIPISSPDRHSAQNIAIFQKSPSHQHRRQLENTRATAQLNDGHADLSLTGPRSSLHEVNLLQTKSPREKAEMQLYNIFNSVFSHS